MKPQQVPRSASSSSKQRRRSSTRAHSSGCKELFDVLLHLRHAVRRPDPWPDRFDSFARVALKVRESCAEPQVRRANDGLRLHAPEDAWSDVYTWTNMSVGVAAFLYQEEGLSVDDVLRTIGISSHGMPRRCTPMDYTGRMVQAVRAMIDQRGTAQFRLANWKNPPPVPLSID